MLPFTQIFQNPLNQVFFGLNLNLQKFSCQNRVSQNSKPNNLLSSINDTIDAPNDACYCGPAQSFCYKLRLIPDGNNCCAPDEGRQYVDAVEIGSSCSGTQTGFECGIRQSRYLTPCNGPNGPYGCDYPEEYIEACVQDNGCAVTEICSDEDGEDDDCDGLANCEDPDCTSSQFCTEVYDKDGDGHYATDGRCGGDDCNDDPNDPNAANIYGGREENSQALCSDSIDNDCDNVADCIDDSCKAAGSKASNPFCQPSPEICDDAGEVDEDLDGFANCVDSDCIGNPACEIGGGGGDDPPVDYYEYSCYAEYLVTTYYSCNSHGCTYIGEIWEFLGITCNAY